MTKFFQLTLFFGLTSFSLAAQWTTNGTGDAYNNNSSGKVGVGTGTSVPTAKLQVVGEAAFGNNGWGMMKVGTDDGTNLWIKTATNDRTLRLSANNSIMDMTNSGSFEWFIGGSSRMYLGSGSLGSTLGNSVLLSRLSGASGNSFQNNTWLYRGANGSDWMTARLHNGISVDFSFLTPGTDTRTWWERDPYNNIQSWGDLNKTYMTINQGNVGMGITSPSGLLHLKTTTSGSFWSSSNYGATLVIDGPHNNAIAFLDASSTNPFAIANVSGKLTISKMPSLGDVSTAPSELLTINNSNGYVGIGNNSPDAKLTVSGQVHAQEVKVTVNAPGPDYVFDQDYKLTSLEEIKNYIDQNKHLPEVPSAKEMEKNGVQLGDMNMLLLKKIEELTLHVIEMNATMEKLKKENIDQLKINESLQMEMKNLKGTIK